MCLRQGSSLACRTLSLCVHKTEVDVAPATLPCPCRSDAIALHVLQGNPICLMIHHSAKVHRYFMYGTRGAPLVCTGATEPQPYCSHNRLLAIGRWLAMRTACCKKRQRVLPYLPLSYTGHKRTSRGDSEAVTMAPPISERAPFAAGAHWDWAFGGACVCLCRLVRCLGLDFFLACAFPSRGTHRACA